MTETVLILAVTAVMLLGVILVVSKALRWK